MLISRAHRRHYEGGVCTLTVGQNGVECFACSSSHGWYVKSSKSSYGHQNRSQDSVTFRIIIEFHQRSSCLLYDSNNQRIEETLT